MIHNTLILAVAALVTLGVISRPLRIPEYVWAVVGTVVLVAFGFLPWRNAVAAAAKGIDVYLFLIGMMLLAELARQEGLFDWLATLAVRHARSSARRLFLIIYSVGTIVTVLRELFAAEKLCRRRRLATPRLIEADADLVDRALGRGPWDRRRSASTIWPQHRNSLNVCAFRPS